jgi:hypothetical protein
MGLLKSRWASLKNIRIQIKKQEDFVKVNEFVICCFILHNIMILVNDPWDVDYTIGIMNVDGNINQTQTQDGEELRNKIKNYWGLE